MIKFSALIVLVIFSGSFVSAYAESVNYIQSQMTEDERENCVTKVVTGAWYVPVRIELEFDELDSTDPNAVNWASTGTAIQFNKNDRTAVIETEEINYHQGKLLLTYPYDLEPDTHHEFYYRIYSESDQVEEGTYLTTDRTFCMVIWFFAQEPPIKYDEAYFEEQYTIIHGTKLDEIQGKQDEGTAYYWMGAVFGMFNSAGVAVAVGVIIFKIKDIKNVLMIPVRHLKKSVETVGRVHDILETTTTDYEAKMNRACERVTEEARKLSDESNQLVMIKSSLQKDVRVKNERGSTFADLLEEMNDDEDIEELKEESKKEGITSKITKIPFNIKEKLSRKVDKDLDEMTEDEMRKYLSKWTYDDLQDLLQYLTNKINTHSESEIDRLKFNIARDIAKRK